MSSTSFAGHIFFNERNWYDTKEEALTENAGATGFIVKYIAGEYDPSEVIDQMYSLSSKMLVRTYNDRIHIDEGNCYIGDPDKLEFIMNDKPEVIAEFPPYFINPKLTIRALDQDKVIALSLKTTYTRFNGDRLASRPYKTVRSKKVFIYRCN